jgi:hypothetical protein
VKPSSDGTNVRPGAFDLSVITSSSPRKGLLAPVRTRQYDLSYLHMAEVDCGSAWSDARNSLRYLGRPEESRPIASSSTQSAYR